MCTRPNLPDLVRGSFTVRGDFHPSPLSRQLLLYGPGHSSLIIYSSTANTSHYIIMNIIRNVNPSDRNCQLKYRGPVQQHPLASVLNARRIYDSAYDCLRRRPRPGMAIKDDNNISYSSQIFRSNPIVDQGRL